MRFILLTFFIVLLSFVQQPCYGRTNVRHLRGHHGHSAVDADAVVVSGRVNSKTISSSHRDTSFQSELGLGRRGGDTMTSGLKSHIKKVAESTDAEFPPAAPGSLPDGSTYALVDPSGDIGRSCYSDCDVGGAPVAGAGPFQRTFTNRPYFGNQNNAANCAQQAHQQGFIYFGLQNGNECYATNSAPTITADSKGRSCNMGCSGDPNTNCGGPCTNLVYIIMPKQ